jgi:uncharacterized membrane protein YdjX (TVP38/TMEM64 family)
MTELKNAKWIKRLLILAVIAAVLVLGGKYLNLQQHLINALEWIKGLGPVGLGVFTGLYVLACIFFIPGSILTLGAGAIYGVVVGSVLVSVSSTLGATAAFLIGRYFARDWVAKRIEGNALFSSIDDAVADGGWKMVGLIRLSPMFPFNLLNYAFGLTKVSLRDYVFASWLGMLPGTIMYVYLGSLASNLATLGVKTDHIKTPGEWVMYGVSLVATILVTVYVTKIAKQALATRITTKDEK